MAETGAANERKDGVAIEFVLNGRTAGATVPPEATLLQVLRDHLHLTGTKCGCEIGQCGACTVILDGLPVASCLVLAGQVAGRRVETVEGLERAATGDRGRAAAGGLAEPRLHPLQEAFLDHDAVACGFCTPGMLMSAKALLDRNPHPTRAQIRRAISGNLCRCTGYQPIVTAIEHVARGREGTDDGGPRMKTTG
jgi:carbon-monoxide dehydrogenase small subunit